MKTSDKTKMIFEAYVNASPELINIAKDSKGYNYTYTSLEKLIEHSKPILHKHGLAIIQLPTGKGIITRIVHNSGEWLEVETSSEIIQLKGMNTYQVQGSQITYLRRYAWASICGIASDDDMDAVGEEVAKPIQYVTPEQVKYIYTMISTKEIDEAKVKQAYGVESMNELTAEQALKLMQQLKAK